MNTTALISPLDGTVVPLEQVPDPVFSQRILGDGVALFPASHTVFAPLDGVISNVNDAKHALVIKHENLEVLIHVGIESVALKGEGFEVFVQKGQTVKAGQKLLNFDFSILKNKAASPLVLLIITSPADTPVTLLAQEQIKTGLPLMQVSDPHTKAQELNSDDYVESDPLLRPCPNGLHARPAAVLTRLLAAYPYRVEIHAKQQVADAKSIVSLMGLGLTCSDSLTIRVYGPQPQAKILLTQLEEACSNGLGEPGYAPAKPQKARAAQTRTASAFSGLCACGGLAYGPAYLLKNNSLSFEENTTNPQAECELLDKALANLSEQMEKRIAAEQNPVSRDILNAHLLLLKDPLLAGSTRQTIASGKTAAFAFNAAIRRSIDILKQTNNRFLMERIADLKDLRREVLGQLTGQQHISLTIPKGSIIVAEDLLPSDVSTLPNDTAGVLLANGSPTTHASILLRNRNIPAIVRVGMEALAIAPNTVILLNADTAEAVVAPTEKQLQDFIHHIHQIRERARQDDLRAREPASTQEGHRIRVEGNVSGAAEAGRSYAAGAEGFGLVRTEFLFQGRAFAPTEEEQRAAYQAVLDASPDEIVTFRMLDAGGDKPLPFINIPPEENPIVGIRGVRAIKNNEDFFRTQLRALLQLTPQKRVRIMLPMVAFTQEVTAFKRMVEEESAALKLNLHAQIGIMIEVPSAAILAEQLAKQVDFFSIGTNDLTQYVLAIDRGHPELSPLADALHPAVLQLMAQTCRGAQSAHKPVAVCGALAGEPDAIPLLVGLGVTSLAVSSGVIGRTKSIIRKLNLAHCAKIAQEALQLPDAHAVRVLVKKEFNFS